MEVESFVTDASSVTFETVETEEVETETEDIVTETEDIVTETEEIETESVVKVEEPIKVEIPKRESNILFVGNSLVSGLDMIAEDKNDFISEIGLGLVKLKSKYFDDIAKYPCDVVVIGMGTNELGSYTEVGFKNYYVALIEHIRSINTNSVIYALSIPPVSERKSNNDELFNNDNVVLFNSYIRDICEETNIVFIDNGEFFGTVLNSEWTSDGMHLYGNIYKKWYQYILEKISEI